MKSEADCYSIHDLAKEPKQTSLWFGVRNYQARNFMRDQMQKGDLAFFYHSNGKPSHIAGIMEIATEKAYPDPTQFDPKDEHYDPKSSPENPRWMLVDVKLKEIFEPIGLPQIKANSKLSKMALVQPGSRLSIQPVTKQEWDEILKMAT